MLYLQSCFLVLCRSIHSSPADTFPSSGPSVRAHGCRILGISKHVGLWLTSSPGHWRWGPPGWPLLGWEARRPCAQLTCTSRPTTALFQGLTLLTQKEAVGQVLGRVIEIQSTLQNDLFDIPSRKLLFVELIIHSCIHEKNTINA